eukprot:4696187-Alexandrium_andersonii.AAC.1
MEPRALWPCGLGPGAWVQLLAPGCKPAALGDLAPWSHRAMEPGAKGPVPGCSAWRLPVACGLRPWGLGAMEPRSHGARDLEAWSPGLAPDSCALWRWDRRPGV